MANGTIKLKALIKEDASLIKNLNDMSLTDIDKIVGRMIQKSDNSMPFNESDYSEKSSKRIDNNRLRLSSWEKLKKHPYSGLSMTDMSGLVFTNPEEVKKYLKEMYKWFDSNRQHYLEQSSIEDLDQEIQDELKNAKNSQEFVDSVNNYLSKHQNKYWYIWFAMIAIYISRGILALATP